MCLRLWVHPPPTADYFTYVKDHQTHRIYIPLQPATKGLQLLHYMWLAVLAMAVYELTVAPLCMKKNKGLYTYSANLAAVSSSCIRLSSATL